MKLSGSPRILGVNRAIDVSIISRAANPNKSLYEK